MTYFRNMQWTGPFFARTSKRVVALAAMVGLAAATAGLTAPAGSQTIEDKRAEAAEVAERIETLQHEYDVLEEDARQASVELTEVQARVSDSEAELALTQTERDGKAAELADYSVDAYIGGPGQDEVSAVLESDSEDVPLRLGYIGSVSGDRTQLIEQLNAAEEDVQFRVQQLEDAEAEAQDLVDHIREHQEAAQSRLSEQQDIEASLDAEIADLVAEQQAAAEAAAAAEAQAQAQAQPSGDGGDTGGSYTGPPPSVSPGAAGAVEAARSRIGAPYQWAGSGPDVFDCSGLTSWAWAQAGRGLSHSSRAQYGETRRVSLSDLQPGDLVFYGSPIYHVGLYVGGGQMIDAPHSGASVSQRSIYAVGTPVGAGRP